MRRYYGRISGKQYAQDLALSYRTGNSRAQIQHMREEGGAFTMANGERVLFCSRESIVNRTMEYVAFERWLKRQDV